MSKRLEKRDRMILELKLSGYDGGFLTEPFIKQHMEELKTVNLKILYVIHKQFFRTRNKE